MAPTDETNPNPTNPNLAQPTINYSDPLYMHPSENAGSSITPVLFDGSGYRSWRRGVLRALSVKNKIVFINGKLQKPDPNSPIFAQWERCDDMVMSWILNSLSKDLADILQYVKNTKKLQDDIKPMVQNCFSSNRRLMTLHREI